MFRESYCKEDDFYYYLLSCSMNIGIKTYSDICNTFSSVKEVFEMHEETRAKTGIFTKAQLVKLNKLTEEIMVKKEEFLRLDEKEITFVPYENDAFPCKLKEIPDCPIGLFYYGKLPCKDIASVAVIGARECSFYGEEVAYRLGEALGRYGIQLISGMARGVDSISQKAAIAQNAPSFGVLGGGVDICYPRESRRLYEDLKALGGVISEYPPGTQPQAMFFVRRNRIISGLADEVCVVEARKKSGTMITVDAALEQGKSVVCVPGKITDMTSRGCNELIMQGASILTDVEEYAAECARKYGRVESVGNSRNDVVAELVKELDDLQVNLIRKLDERVFSASDVSGLCHLNFSEALMLCLALCDKKLLANLGAGQFRLTGLGLKIKN